MRYANKMMLKIVLAIIAIVAISIAILVLCNTGTYCTDTSHRTTSIVNPYCSKCHGRDGIVTHTCQNPDGPDIYCIVCGKTIKE